MTQRKSSQSETPEDFVLKSPEVSQSPPKIWLPLDLFALTITFPVIAAFTYRGNRFIGGQDCRKGTVQWLRQEQGADREEETS